MLYRRPLLLPVHVVPSTSSPSSKGIHLQIVVASMQITPRHRPARRSTLSKIKEKEKLIVPLISFKN